MRISCRLFRRIIISFIISVLCMGGCFSAFAKDYTDYQVTGCRWEVEEDGHIYARWDKPPKASAFVVSVYYYLDEDLTEERTALKNKQVSSPELDLTELIISKGTYLYYFTAGPATGGNRSCIDESGELLVTSEMMKNAKSLYKEASVQENGVMNTFSLNVKESGAPGTVRSLAIRDNKYAVASGVEYSKPEDQWTPGETVTVNVTYTAKDGYSFSDATSFGCKKANIVSQTGDSKTRNFVIEYVPKLELEAPEGVYLDSDGKLLWNSVDKASRYNVQYYFAGIKEDSKIYTSASADISRYIDDLSGAEELVVRVFAIGSLSNQDYYLSSEPAELLINEENTYDGEFEPNRRPPLYSKNGKAEGWNCISGKWFYFVNGEAMTSTLWTDPSDGYTYYFSKRGIMQTGTVAVGDETHTFNDGTDAALPLGAMIK